uniref:BFN domain-containing protein n=1 Tax=Thermotoga petrophila TaxID=93929 RepID=Q5CBM7_9THEM|nr:hypothetical protein [Thermotoga petrophila RKU-10]CAI44420.1 hypothetical protein [Thermotoga sp. RQ2]
MRIRRCKVDGQFFHVLFPLSNRILQELVGSFFVLKFSCKIKSGAECFRKEGTVLRKAWVKTLALDRVSNTPVVILGIEGTNRVLPIWIGACEGHALALAMEKMEFPRPLTHDLLLSVLESLEARVDKVIIHSLKDNTFYATLVIRDLTYTDEEDEEAALIDIDSRPSDAIILAVKTGAPIFVSDNLVEKHSIELEVNETQDEEEEFKKFVENLNIDTFKQMIEKKREEDEEGES